MSPYAIPVMPPGVRRFIAGYLIHFSDGGEPEEQVLHIGTLEDCQRTMELLSAVAYNGSRPGARAEGVVYEYPEVP